MLHPAAECLFVYLNFCVAGILSLATRPSKGMLSIDSCEVGYKVLTGH
jgi:hypothetical protein